MKECLVSEFNKAYAAIKSPSMSLMKDFIIGVLSETAFRWAERKELLTVIEIIKEQCSLSDEAMRGLKCKK